MKNINLSIEEVYREIYDGHIGVKQFKKWMNERLQEAYYQGVNDADAPPSYDELSRSQYD